MTTMTAAEAQARRVLRRPVQYKRDDPAGEAAPVLLVLSGLDDLAVRVYAWMHHHGGAAARVLPVPDICDDLGRSVENIMDAFRDLRRAGALVATDETQPEVYVMRGEHLKR